MPRSLSPAAASLLAASLMAAFVAPGHAQAPPGARDAAEACARAKSEFVAQHPEVLGPPRALIPGQENYDVTYYDLDATVQTAPIRIAGTLTMRARVVSPTLTQAILELRSAMTITAVRAGDVPVTYAFNAGILTINLDRTYAQGETFEVQVSYNGNVGSGTSLQQTMHNGVWVIWSLSEPYGAHTWWPCKDTPQDKADSVDVHWNVPSTHIAASNGKLVSVTYPTPGRAVYNWHESYPIATYLVSIAAYPYTVYSDWYHYAPGDSMEVRFFVYPDHYEQVQETYALTVPMITAFAHLFGEYPFVREKYGHAEFEGGGAMENQTCTSMGLWPMANNEFTICHELAHQWWGDHITCETFNHIWLNEGFATYSEALWVESAYGMQAYHDRMAGMAYYGAGTVYVEDPTTEPIFDAGLSYFKAGYVLHMLRHVLGDDVFFQCLQAYGADPTVSYGTATTEQFRDICERVSGLDLHEFFHQWIYEEYYPSYRLDWSTTPHGGGGYDVALAIDQLQTNYVFTMPIDVTMSTAAGETTLVVQNSQAHQEYAFTVSAEPTRIELDKDNWILRTPTALPMPEPTFDRGILVVNGVNLDSFGNEITSCYADSVFWGNHPFSFWETFPEGSWTYPPNMPAPLGYGAVPPDMLKQFSAVVWVGDDLYSAVGPWADTPLYSYLLSGGNLLLITRAGQVVVSPLFQDYLGITWREGDAVTLTNCTAVYPGLVNVSFIGSQSGCAPFDATLASPESHLLFKDTHFSPPRGIGVWHKPLLGGTYRPDGGQFIYWAGRPYRMNHDQLRANMQYILGSDDFFDEPYTPTSVPEGERPSALRYALVPNRPNPSSHTTTLSFALPVREEVSLRIYDVAGRMVRSLLAGPAEAGRHTVVWDGTNDAGRTVSSGIYCYELTTPHFSATRKLVLMRR
jgi:aminopeptidase N